MAEGDVRPRSIDYALTVQGIDFFDEDQYVATFADRWGGLDQAALARALWEGEGAEKLFAIVALGYHPDLEAQALLLPLLESADRLERWAAAESLAEVGERRALPIVRSMLTEFLPTQLEEYFAEAPSLYDSWRASAPSLLGDLHDSEGIPFLRRAALHVVRLVSQSPLFAEAERVALDGGLSKWREFTPEEIRYIRDVVSPGKWYTRPNDQDAQVVSLHGKLSGNQPGLLHLLMCDLDDIIYTLGRLGAFGALTGMQAPELYLRLWMAHLVMGHLDGRFTAAEVYAAAFGKPEGAMVAETLAPLLLQYFGLNEEEQAQTIWLYGLTLELGLASTLESVEREKQRRRQVE